MPPLDRGIGIILLAAGRGTRFGGDKLSRDLRGKPLWNWAALAAEKAGFSQRYLVCRPDSSLCLRAGWEAVINHHADEGMGSSIAAGVAAAAPKCERLVIALADMPLVEPGHFRDLARLRGTVFTRYDDGAEGPPAAFPKKAFAALQTLTGERGARHLDLGETDTLIPANGHMLADVDTPAALDALSR